jgi:hypothetical protein
MVEQLPHFEQAKLGLLRTASRWLSKTYVYDARKHEHKIQDEVFACTNWQDPPKAVVILRFVGNSGISVRTLRNTTTNLSQANQFLSRNLNMVMQATNQKAKHPTTAFGFDRKEKKYSNRRSECILHSCVDKTWSRFVWKWKLHGATCCNNCSRNKLPPLLSRFTVLHFTVRENSGRQVTHHS